MLVVQEMSFAGSLPIEITLHGDLTYRLRYADEVVYENGFKTVLGKKSRYEFRSVEQLRYDFERDVAAAGGRLGEDS